MEDGIHVHPVYVWTVVDRTDWLEEARALASRGVFPLRVAETYPPSGLRTRSGGWRPAASAAAP